MTQANNVAIESSQINSSGVLQVAGGGTGVTTSTGSGNNVLSASPTLSGTAVIPIINAGASTALTLQSNGTTAITVDTSQNVGIGTTSPAYRLDIQGNTTGQFWASIKNTNAGATAIGGWYFGNDTYSDVGGVFVGSTGGSGFGGANSMNIGSWRSAPLSMFTNNTERMRITSAGNVGIGTSSPAQALDVTGNVQSSANILGPLFFINRANAVDNISIGGILNLIEQGGGGSYNSNWHYGQFGPITNASTSPMTWNRARVIFRLFNTSAGGQVTSVLQMQNYFYASGYGNMGSTFSVFIDGARGYATVVGPWFTPSDLAYIGDVGGYGVKVVSGNAVTFGPAFLQYSY